MKETQLGKGFVQVLLLVAVVILILVFLVPKLNQKTSTTTSTDQPAAVAQTPVPMGVVALMLNPTEVNTTQNGTFSVEVQVDTKTETISAVELHLAFDPNYLQATSVKNGILLPVVLATGKMGAGTASLVVGANPTSPEKGTGTIAIVTFKAIKAGITKISIDSTSKVAAIGKNTNVLGSTTDAAVTIK